MTMKETLIKRIIPENYSSCISIPVGLSLSSDSSCLTKQGQIVSEKWIIEYVNKIRYANKINKTMEKSYLSTELGKSKRKCNNDIFCEF